MDSDYDIFEIVQIAHDFWLFDAESYQRQYCTQGDQPLAPGFYVVTWPEWLRTRRFNKHASYHGPFKLRREAQVTANRMREERNKSLKMLSKIRSVAIPISSRMYENKQASHGLKSTKVA